MSLRARLIVAFFVLSVVPLTAVTAFSYRNNAQALRVAAERETDVLAGELGQRMQLVTAQLSEPQAGGCGMHWVLRQCPRGALVGDDGGGTRADAGPS